MRFATVCRKCGSSNGDYIGHDLNRWYCNECRTETGPAEKSIATPYERTRSAVYATGNRWAIENFNATH